MIICFVGYRYIIVYVFSFKYFLCLFAVFLLTLNHRSTENTCSSCVVNFSSKCLTRSSFFLAFYGRVDNVVRLLAATESIEI